MVEIKTDSFPPLISRKTHQRYLPYVLSVSEKYDGMIYLLHVVENLSKWGGGSYIPHIPLDQYQEEAFRGAEKALDTVCEEQLQSCPNFQKGFFSVIRLRKYSKPLTRKG